MTYLFTKTLSRRPEYNSLVEEFEDYDEEEIQNLEEVKEECKRKKDLKRGIMSTYELMKF